MQGATYKPAGALLPIQLQAAKYVIEAHMQRDTSVSDIAAGSGLGAIQCARAFKHTESVSPYRYLLERREERTKQFIESEDVPLAAVGERVGFSSARHFSRTSCEIAGTPPRDFRKSTQP